MGTFVLISLSRVLDEVAPRWTPTDQAAATIARGRSQTHIAQIAVTTTSDRRGLHATGTTQMGCTTLEVLATKTLDPLTRTGPDPGSLIEEMDQLDVTRCEDIRRRHGWPNDRCSDSSTTTRTRPFLILMQIPNFAVLTNSAIARRRRWTFRKMKSWNHSRNEHESIKMTRIPRPQRQSGQILIHILLYPRPARQLPKEPMF